MRNTQFDEVTVRIQPLAERIQIESRKNGLVTVKEILPDDLIKIFGDSSKETRVIDSGFLPENCLSVRVSDNKKDIVLWRPAGYADFTYYNTLYERFPLPRMVFAFWLNPDGRTTSHRLAIIADERPTPKTRLFVYPFSNVYTHTGICIGAANSMPVHKSPRTLAALMDFILGLPNNDHNFSANDNRLGLGYRDLLEHLKDKDPSYYYENVLISRNFTLQDFIDNQVKGEYAHGRAAA